MFRVNKELPKISNIVFSKEYELKNKELSKNFEDTKELVINDKIGLSIKYDEKASIPLVLYSYFKNIPEDFFDNLSEYIDKLYKASIVCNN